MLEGVGLPSGTELSQVNEIIISEGTIGLIVLAAVSVISFAIWVLRAEKSFNKRVDSRIDNKMEVHKLEKLPLYTRVDNLEEQHKEILDRVLDIAEDLSNNMKALSSQQTEMREEISFIKGKIENK